MAKKESVKNTNEMRDTGERNVINESVFSIRKMLKSKDDAQKIKAISLIETMGEVSKEILSDIKNYLWQYGKTPNELVDKMSKIYERHDPEGYATFVALRNKSMGSTINKEKKPPFKNGFVEEEAKDFGDSRIDLVAEIDTDEEEEEESE
jgi:hypothetical protein